MRFQLIKLLFLLLIPTMVRAQSGEDGWLNSLKANAIKPGSEGVFKNTQSGLALYFERSGSINQPYWVYVPKGYDPGKATPLVVFLHGAVLATDSFQCYNKEVTEEPIFKVADELNTLILFPFARQDFKWTHDKVVFDNILRMIEQTEYIYNVDKGRVYMGGQSMGGNATFWIIAHSPDQFAGFFTFSANPAGADLNRLSPKKPLVSMNAKDDKLYRFETVESIWKLMKATAPGWDFMSAETGGHRFIYGKGGDVYVKSVLKKLMK